MTLTGFWGRLRFTVLRIRPQGLARGTLEGYYIMQLDTAGGSETQVKPELPTPMSVHSPRSKTNKPPLNPEPFCNWPETPSFLNPDYANQLG